MELNSVEIVDSSLTADTVRLLGQVSYEDRSRTSESYWFDVPVDLATYVSLSGNPWLACLLPLAATRGEPLRIPQAVDPHLLANAETLLKIWRCWYPNLQTVAIEAPVSPNAPQDRGSLTAALFSGGLDSLFTVIRNSTNCTNPQAAVKDLLMVWGFDIPLQRPGAFRRHYARQQQVADHFGLRLVPIATNLRATLWNRSPWGQLAHGAALASVGLLLEKRYCRVLIASSHGYTTMTPWGSHVLTDPLFSTQSTQIVHDGSEYTRWEKAQFLASSDIALGTLHVCWRDGSERNCGSCSKCYRTMMMLDLCGALGRAATFPVERFSLRNVGRIYVPSWNTWENMEHMHSFAKATGRQDYARAIEKSLRYSRRLSRLLRILGGLRWRVRKRRITASLARYAASLERVLLRRSIS